MLRLKFTKQNDSGVGQFGFKCNVLRKLSLHEAINNRVLQVTRYKNRNITSYREWDYERHAVSEREWKKIFREARAGRVPGGIVPKLLTAGGQPCYRRHVLAIGRPAGEREVETGGRRLWDTGRGTEAALLNSHPIDTPSSRGMCESIGNRRAKCISRETIPFLSSWC